jgi:Bacterial regulatory proteins, gntR family
MTEAHRKPLQHPASTTAAERVQHRYVVAAGSSPFYDDEPRPQPIDRSQIVGCPADGCISRFLNDEFLAKHMEIKHQARQTKTTAEEIAAAVDRVTETITSRISGGDLKPGDVIRQSALADELGYPRTRVEAAVTGLVREGVLGFSGAGSARRTLVV